MARGPEGVAVELTTVTEEGAVLHEGTAVLRLDGLAPDSEHEIADQRFRTLPRPAGERLATVATVNDLHLGETECGRHDTFAMGPVLAAEPGTVPYPEVMARGAAAEIAEVAPDAVVAKGDLTATGRPEELATFDDCFGTFDGRLHWVRGNHDVVDGGAVEGRRTAEVALPGVVLALLDTSVPGEAGGALGGDQLEWLDEVGARADRPVLVFGHHQPWDPGESGRSAAYFGIRPDDSERLVDVFARRTRLVGYFAGHTHRNRVRRFAATGDVPWVEVGSTKDFPGGWAEYRVFEGGMLQVFHRTSTPAALAWSERTRSLFGGLYPAYSFGGLADRCLPVSFRTP